MKRDQNTWIENWQREVDLLFRQLQAIPPELVDDVAQLRAWNEQANQLSAEILEIRERLRLKRLEREVIKARIDAIVERQRIATEIEIEERRLQKWRQRMEQIKDYIDRVTDKIILEMRQRQQDMLLEAAMLNEQTRQQTEEDLRVWEAFKLSLEAPTKSERDPQKDLEAQQTRQEQERLREEYKAIKSRPKPTLEENQAAWDEFVEDLEDPSKKNRRPRS
jgi:hypothetical protein